MVASLFFGRHTLYIALLANDFCLSGMLSINPMTWLMVSLSLVIATVSTLFMCLRCIAVNALTMLTVPSSASASKP